MNVCSLYIGDSTQSGLCPLPSVQLELHSPVLVIQRMRFEADAVRVKLSSACDLIQKYSKLNECKLKKVN